MIYSDGMTEVNGNGKRETGKARARRVMAEKLAEEALRKRIEQDEADLGVVLAALDARYAAASRRDLAVVEAQQRCAQACDAADEDAAAGIVRWLRRGESVKAVADATGLPVAEVARLRKLGEGLNAAQVAPVAEQVSSGSELRSDETSMPAAQFDALVGSIDEPDPAPRLTAAALDPGRGTLSGPADVEG